MCDVCVDFHDLLLSYDERSSKEQDGLATLCISDVDTTLHYVNQWVQRQCMCCYREIKNFDRFIRLTQSVVLCTLQQLQIIQQNGQQANAGKASSKDEKEEEEKASEGKTDDADFAQTEAQTKQNWSQQDREKLFHLLSKIFLLNFPLYIAMKHGGAINPLAPVKDEGGYCEPHDPEVPAPLIRAVSIFCHQGGFNLMSACFDMESTLPVSLAHSMVAVICNLKLWLNYGSVIQLFIPLRSRVMKYMCRLGDKELRTPAVRTMADFMWSAVKDPIDAVLPSFDRDGLDLAFKYFTSTTLTMRLAGIAQINAHITAFNELCNSETVAEVEQVGHALAAWLTENNIIAHIFGPNLHVEVIKQSHIVLSFLAMEGRITSSDMDTMWQAAQLKHCGRPVYDLLAPLVKHLAPTPVLHLYSLLGKLEPKDHTEQSLFLASALIKFIWTAGGSGYPRGLTIKNRDILRGNCGVGGSSTSDPSGMDGSSPDEDEEEPSPAPSEGPSPRKQARGDSSDGEGPFKAKSVGAAVMQAALNEVEGSTLEKSECSAESMKESACTVQDDMKEKQSGSDAEADTEKSNAEETVTIEKKKRKVLRKRKKPQKRSLATVDKTLEDIVNQENGMKNKDLMLDIKNRAEDVLNSTLDTGGLVSLEDPKGVDALDRVKQQAMALDPSDQQVPTTAALLRRANKNKYMSLVGHNVDRAPDSADTSHDEDDSDVAGVLAAADGPSAVISELAGLVHATGPTFLPSGLDEMLSDEEGSYSSRISNKSEKNMADFDGEESGCEEELAQLAARHLTAIQMQAYHPHHSHPTMTIRRSVCRPPQVRSVRQTVTRVSSQFNLDTVCKPGNTLLWDLLQDDKIGQLGEGLALEAEKALCNLLCFNVDRLIPMKFIEGCLENLATNRSVVVSLRLLPKLLASFQQFGAMDAHTITTWADRERGMMKHFFNNLKTYTSIGPKNSLYSHQTEIQVRLQFLSSIFSPLGSPECFRLSLEQVDILWQCLSQDPTCADELFSWLLSQAKSTEQHALGMDTLKHLCMRKLPSLPPETISMTGLSLFQQLCNLARLAAAHLDRPLRDVDSVGMDFLWRIALKAKSTDVSMAAIQYLNGYYMSRQLTQEAEFVSQCMTHLAAASADLEINEEASLRCIQRALLLLRTHLEAFRKRYAYHLRRWVLEGRGAGSHVAMNTSEKGQQLRIFVQPAGIPEKTSFILLSTDYVADLRAEVAKWWDDTQNSQEKTSSTANSNQNNGSVLGSLLTDGPIRMITQGQELTIDFDEKTLQEMGFKDGQLVFISPGAGRSNGTGRCNKRDMDSPSLLPPPPRESLPTLLLLRPQYFEQLFTLMRTLSAMRTIVKGGQEIPHTKSQVLSRRVWDTLTLLPTSPTLLRGFQKLGETTLPELLDPASPQKLMYSLYIVESLSRRSTTGQPSAVNSSSSAAAHEGGGDADDNHEDKEKDVAWSALFVQHGGLRHLFDIFMSGCLEQGDGSEWQQDCLASLLKQLCLLGVVKEEKKRSKADKLIVPKLSEAMLSMMNVDAVMARITNILNEVSLPRDPNHYKTGLFGRSQVIQYTMALLVCWVHSDETVRQYLFSSSEPFGKTWLRRLVLEDPEPAVRREVCTALYSLCLGTTGSEDDNSDVSSLIVPMLNTLLEHLVIAEAMQPSHRKPDLPLHLHPVLDDGKEPYGPACRDYFWLVCRLVDSLPEEAIKEGSDDSNLTIDLETLAIRVIDSVLNREHLETRHNTVEDDGLVGLLNLTCNIMTHNPPCKQGKIGQNLLHEVFDFLFALPNPRSKHVPKCKSQVSRSAGFDLLVELVKSTPDNYRILHEKLLAQHKPGPHSPYPWDYWPHEDGRSDCGYVGLTNLGATCYMASCMQHLYMMPQARVSILGADCNRANKHQLTLRELQRMFAYLLESERKAYNPRSFCRVYTMNHEPLNTGEQKDMAEFFIDLVSKLEEMTSDLKNLVKTLFCGVISNNVVSLDCEHVSRTLEEFYTVRCQVADMRNLYESLDEVTVKDTLEGDNMYTCSQCGKKARAEKRACFKKLPHILCFNTMRYTFNMGTMLKEKVNTHFSFPLRLDMSGYVEKKLMPQHYQEEKKASEKRKSEVDCQAGLDNDVEGEEMEHYQYDLIGVTVHTGTADGGHYYSFIRDRTSPNKDKWFLFNDAEVKPFDPNQIAAECFGGEMTSKTYDSVTDKFMDFSFEKTNSAYMLFYEWCADPGDQAKEEEATVSSPNGRQLSSLVHKNTNKLPPLELNKELEDWIWQDNMHFLQDKNIFEHTYFTFMWQICGYIPQTLLSVQSDITEMSADLSTSFFMETFIHAKEKPTMVQWVELLTKQFNSSAGACARFLERMAGDSWWPIQILVKCPNQMVRQMFQRLCIHVIQRLRATQAPLYLLCDEENDINTVGTRSCVTRFVRMLLSLMEHAKQHLKHLTEYFSFLYEFSKMGEEETLFLIRVQAISTMVNFYLGHKTHEFVDAVSEEEEEEEIVAMPTEKLRPASLDKMITLIATLVERSRGSDHRLALSPADLSAVAGGKGFPFLYQQTRDVINLNQTRNLIQSLCRWNDRLAVHIVTMIFQAITKHTDVCQPFFKLLTLLTESSGPSGLPCMTQLILGRVWEAARVAPHGALEWLALAVTRSKLAHAWVLQGLDTWLQHFLLEHSNQRVRSAAAFLLVSLVPSTHFRQSYRSAHRLGLGCNTSRELQLSPEATLILHQIYTALLRLLQPARHYIDIQTHGTMKLTAYFALLTYCVVSKTEKLMFGQYLNDLWTLFHPKLSEPSIPVHHNKQAVLLFWYHVCSDCPENVALILHNPHITKNIAFNYILADHEDQDVVLFNRVMLPAYYGLLRLCCQQSRTFTRQLAAHQNIQWAFKNITPHPTQYSTLDRCSISLPANLEETLDLSLSLQDYHLQEVTLYAKQGRTLGSALSTQDIMALQRQEERRRQQAKQGVFGFVFKKSKESSLSTDSLGGRSASPARSDETGRSTSPLQPPARPQRKRRPAPKPPTLAQAEVSNGSEENTGDSSKDKVVISHSRNSSDSSGYHEASVLSDNPDSAGRLPETLPRRNRLPIETPRKLAHTSQSSKSLSNLAFVPGTLTHGISSTSLSSAGLRKKRTAPPPPANRPLSSAISTQALERIVDSEESLTSDMEPSKPASDIGESEARPKANSDIGVATVGTKLSPDLEPEPANPELKACKLEVAPRHRAGSVNAKLPSEEPRNVAPVEDAPVDARVPRKRAGEPAPLPKPRKTSATGSTLATRPQVPKRKLAPPSPLSRTLSSSSSNVDCLPSTASSASDASSGIPCGTSVDSFESARRSSVRSGGKPESGEKVDATSVCSTSEDEVFLTPEIDQSEACFDCNSITLEEKEEGSLKMVGNSGKESSNHEVREDGDQSAKSSARSTPRQEKKLCAVISTVPKCAHLDLLAESGDLLSNVERGKKAQEKQSAEAKAGVDEVTAQNREPKRARIPRTASKSNDFETNTLEKQKRHLTSHAEDITFALNLNVTSNVGLRQKEQRDNRCQDVGGGELHHGLGGSDTKLSQTDVLLQKVSDTLSNSLPVSPPSTRVQKLEAISVSKKTDPSAIKKSINQQDFTDSAVVSTSTPNLTVNSQQDTSDYVSAADEDLSIADWEYQLPAPPSAFRDTASPSFESFEEVTESPEPFGDAEIKGQAEALHREPKDSAAKAPESQEPEKRTQEKPYRQLRSECSLKKEVICELENRISTLPQGAKDSDSRRPSDNSSTPKVAPVDNPLSNFTITTYSRQKNLNIFEEVEEQSRRKNADDRFVKSFATLSRNRSNSDEPDDRGPKEVNAGTLQGKRRVNAEDEVKKLEPKTQTDTSQRWQAGNEKGSVQRSKSYVSVCDKPEPQGDPAQQGVRNGGHAEEVKDAAVKKATSITSLNATAPTGNERFSQWREKILKRQEEPTKEKQLQSLQVLKSILPQLKNAQQAEENVPKESDDTVLPEKTRPQTASTEHSVESNVVSARDSRPAPSSKDPEPGSKKPPPETSAKRYTYSGPPAISLGSWSERPSVNIQIKMGTDYKLGLKRASGRTIVNINGTRDEIDGSNCAEDSTKPHDKGKLEAAPSERREPNELARKLITHTTASGFKKPVLNRLASEAKPTGSEKPVVTGVELKKSFAEGSAVDTSPVNFQELTKAFGQDVCLRPKPKRSTLTRRSDVQIESDPGKQNGHCVPEKSNSSDQYLTNNQDSRPKRFTSVVGIHPQNQGSFPFRNGNLPVVKGFKISSAKLDQNQNREAAKESRNGVPKPPTMPVITGVTLKNARPKSMPVQADQRDVLLESIRNFGGRENLKSATERC